jgi:ABC-type uncharacterized transport system permease subunit
VRLRLLGRAVGVEARRTLAYPLDFWVDALVAFLVTLGVSWTLWNAVYDASGEPRIGGLDRHGMILYFVTVLLAARAVRGADLGDATVSSDIYQGGLTKHLLYPAPYPALKYAQHLGGATPILVQLLLFAGPSLVLVDTAEARVSPASLGMGVVSLVAANLLYWLMTFPLHCVAFWAENVWSLVIALRFVGNFLGGVMIPLAAFPAWSRRWSEVLPFRHFYGEPAETLLGRRDVGAWVENLGWVALWCVAFAVLGRLVFARGRRRYSGPGI